MRAKSATQLTYVYNSLGGTYDNGVIIALKLKY